MTAEEKIKDVLELIRAEEKSLCPFCFSPTESIKNNAGAYEELCYNHDDGDYIISIEDYYRCIKQVANYGTKARKYPNKKITDF